jgi:hypothetical protein
MGAPAPEAHHGDRRERDAMIRHLTPLAALDSPGLPLGARAQG